MRAGQLPRLPLAAALCGLAVTAACAPARVPVEQAEQSCANDVSAYRMQPRPRMSMGVGIGGSGRVTPHAGLSVSMAPERAAAHDIAAEYQHCVMQRSGQMPRRPLAGYPRG